ncbi:MAG: HAMP domain-containing sensor histidine kinase [Acidobacteria bacterium]|nr:HAMP domain-containing sensor histidine kinase [Acidobacteriota bacterium]
MGLQLTGMAKGFGWRWFAPRYLSAAGFLGSLLVVLVLGLLGWRILGQERELEAQRLQERLEDAADLLVARMQTALSEAEKRIAGYAGLDPGDWQQAVSDASFYLEEDALLVRVGADGFQVAPERRLPYFPPHPSSQNGDVPGVTLETETGFALAEKVEFQDREYLRAAAAFRQLTTSRNPAVRASALLGMGRNQRKAEEFEAALETYQELAGMGSVLVDGLPAELVARHSRCTLFQRLGQQEALEREARDLRVGLAEGRWPLSQAAYRFYADEAAEWSGGIQLVPSAIDHALVEGVAVLSEEWQRQRGGRPTPEGRQIVFAEAASALLLWRQTRSYTIGFVLGQDFLAKNWLGLPGLEVERNLSLALTGPNGRRVLGEPLENHGQQAIRSPGESRLPWTLHVASRDPEMDRAGLSRRRNILFAGFAMAGLLFSLSVFFMGRAVAREMEVAQLRSEFVASVSHDFQTPLTSLRQVAEVLATGRIGSEDRRQKYYDVLQRQTKRLHRLVKGLLDFARMEAGAMRFRVESFTAAGFVEKVVAEFQTESPDRTQQIRVELPDSTARIQADREALAQALWNLLDNATKYSPRDSVIHVRVRTTPSTVEISVADQGAGIEEHEKKAIFQKFVRGSSSKRSPAAGTGLGLAMVDRMVRAHNGRVTLESRPGEGSTFTIVLPLEG